MFCTLPAGIVSPTRQTGILTSSKLYSNVSVNIPATYKHLAPWIRRDLIFSSHYWCIRHWYLHTTKHKQMHTYVHTYIHVCVCVCSLWRYINIYIHIHACIHVRMYVYIYMHVYVYAYIYVCMYSHINICVSEWVSVCVCVCVYLHIVCMKVYLLYPIALYTHILTHVCTLTGESHGLSKRTQRYAFKASTSSGACVLWI